MKIKLVPKSKLGKWSVGLIIAFFVLVGIFVMFISLGERGGMTYFSNLKLAIPGTAAWVCAIASFFVGLAGVIKQKERSILVFLSMLLGFLVLVWMSLEFMFPH